MARLLFWWACGSLVGGACGVLCAAFLWALAWADGTRSVTPILVLMLPVCGLVLGAVLERLPKAVLGGNDLVIRALSKAGYNVPAALLPTAFIGTVLGHLFGASVGQEGTAVQMGASVGEQFARVLRLGHAHRIDLLTAGVAGGFGAVFGTPVAGAVFAIEFVRVDSLRTTSWLPAIIAACVGNWVTYALGCRHMTFPAAESLAISWDVALRWLGVALAAAALASLFVFALETLRHQLQRLVPLRSVRMALGGLAIALAVTVLHTPQFLGGGLDLIEVAFDDVQLSPFAWLGKLFFTVMSLGSGFVGGEVTPLFVMGACLGNTLSSLFALPLNLCCGVTMTSLFAAASKTPVAMSVMAVEAMGTQVWPHAALVCAAAVWLSGTSGIYERPSEHELATAATP